MTGSFWADGDAYERYMGRWSHLVARHFVAGLDVPPGLRWLDVGCGTGALSSVVLDTHLPAFLLGVDASEGFVESARARFADRGDDVRFEVADATHLPLAPESVDAAISGLVLNFVPSPAEAVAEMARVTASGGTVAAYVWDYANGMPIMSAFWDAAVALNPAAEALDQSALFVRWQPDFMHGLLAGTPGIEIDSVAVRPIEVDADFDDFDDYWSPFLGGQGPAPAYAMSLDEDDRSALRERVRQGLAVASGAGITLPLRAWAASARVRH